MELDISEFNLKIQQTVQICACSFSVNVLGHGTQAIVWAAVRGAEAGFPNHVISKPDQMLAGRLERGSDSWTILADSRKLKKIETKSTHNLIGELQNQPELRILFFRINLRGEQIFLLFKTWPEPAKYLDSRSKVPVRPYMFVIWRSERETRVYNLLLEQGWRAVNWGELMSHNTGFASSWWLERKAHPHTVTLKHQEKYSADTPSRTPRTCEPGVCRNKNFYSQSRNTKTSKGAANMDSRFL